MTEKMARLGGLLAAQFAFRDHHGEESLPHEPRDDDERVENNVERAVPVATADIVAAIDAGGFDAGSADEEIVTEEVERSIGAVGYQLAMMAYEDRRGPYLDGSDVGDLAVDAMTSAGAGGDDLLDQLEADIRADLDLDPDPLPEGLEPGVAGFLVFHGLASAPTLGPDGLEEDEGLIF